MRQHSLGRGFTAPHAVRDAYPMVRAAGQRQTRVLGHPFLNLSDQAEVPNHILRHRAWVTRDADE